MEIKIEEWVFADDDHMWLEGSNPAAYVSDKSCDGCGSDMLEIAKILNSNDSVGLITGMCPNCGYVKRVRNLSQVWYANHFAKRWLSGSNASISDQQVLKADSYVFDKLREYIPAGGRILDAGCGIGQRLLPFYEEGFEVYGFDPSEHRTNIVFDKLPNIAISGAEQYLRDTELKFDLIYFFNVLQFVENPFEVIRLASERLAEGGVLFFSVGQFYNDANYCQFAHLGVIRSFLSLFSLVEVFTELELWPVQYTEAPFEIVLQKGVKNNKSIDILNSAKKVTQRDIEKFVERSLNVRRLKILGKTDLRYLGRKVSLRKVNFRGESLPVLFRHMSEEAPILLK